MHPSITPNEVQLLRNGTEFFPALVQAIDAAVHEVHLETYIFNFEGAGLTVAQALLRAAERGVCVRLVVDGAGTGKLPLQWIQRFAQSGVKCHTYDHLSFLGLWQSRYWRRLHRKLCVVDQRVAFCGGINLLDDFLDHKGRGRLPAPRLDYAVRVSGHLVQVIHDTMRRLWLRLEAIAEWRNRDVRAALDALREVDPDPDLSRRGPVQLVLRDNVRYRSQIERTYRKAIGSARQDILIACAFFFPGHRLRRALILAARRGVRVRLLLQGHYEYFFPYHAARNLYGHLLAAGVEIYEYHASFLHAKVAVIDGHWATVGSSNLDPLSLLLAREANIVVQDAAFAQELISSLQQAIAQGATLIDPLAYAARSWWQRSVDILGYWLLRFGVVLTGKHY